MVTLFAVVHLVLCLGLIMLVLLQDPKGGAASGVFGGQGASTLLGTSGAANFLTKLTSWCAVLFGVTCLLMTIVTKTSTTSVVDKLGDSTAPVNGTAPAAQNGSAPAASPAASPAAPGASPAAATTPAPSASPASK